MTQKISPQVSVIIPTYNYAKFISEAIKSVLNQNYNNIEIIVIDDGSTDDTREIVISKFPQVKYFYQENKGLSAARNTGINKANGDFLVFLDSDDLLGYTSIKHRVDFLQKNPYLSFTLCKTILFKSIVKNRLQYPCGFWHQPKKNDLHLAMYFFNIGPPHAFMVRREVIKKFKLQFDTTLHACEDYDFWFRLAAITQLPGLCKNGFVYYRQHANSMSKSKVNQYRHDAILVKKTARYLTEKSILLIDNNKQQVNGYVFRQESDNLSVIQKELFVLLASTIITARRLWFVDREYSIKFIDNFFSDLFSKFNNIKFNCQDKEIFVYRRHIRIALCKMFFNDNSIDKKLYQTINDKFKTNKILMLESIRVGFFEFIKTIRSDIYYILFLTFRSHQK